MKSAAFLIKLNRDGKLGLVEPSEDIAKSYLKKSESYLASAKILLDNGRLEESVSMAYYSMYHALTALLFRNGIKCENHSASIILMKELFGLDNSKILFAKKERVDKQYYVDFRLTKGEVRDMIALAEEFAPALVDLISKLDSGKIRECREKMEGLLRGSHAGR